MRISLIRASTLYGYVAFLDTIGSPVDSLLGEVCLDRETVADRFALVSEFQAWQFIDRASQLEGIEDLGWFAMQHAGLSDIGFMLDMVARSPTLAEAITTFLRLYRVHCIDTAERFAIQAHLGNIFFIINNPPNEYFVPGAVHTMSFSIMMVLKLFRQYLGESWVPLELHIRFGSKEWEAFAKEHQVELHIGGRVSGIVFPRTVMPSPSKVRSPVFSGKEVIRLFTIPMTFKEAFLGVMGNAFSHGRFKIEEVAELLNASPRSIQRHLYWAGTSYRLLLDEIRQQKALYLFDKGVSVKEVARELGYARPEHLNRAFRRWTGFSPREYQKQGREGSLTASMIEEFDWR